MIRGVFIWFAFRKNFLFFVCLKIQGGKPMSCSCLNEFTFSKVRFGRRNYKTYNTRLLVFCLKYTDNLIHILERGRRKVNCNRWLSNTGGWSKSAVWSIKLWDLNKEIYMIFPFSDNINLVSPVSKIIETKSRKYLNQLRDLWSYFNLEAFETCQQFKYIAIGFYALFELSHYNNLLLYCCLQLCMPLFLKIE